MSEKVPILVNIFSQSSPMGTRANAKSLDEYNGTTMDVDACMLYQLFQNELDLGDKVKINLHVNRTHKELLKILNSKIKENNEHKLFIFVFLTYLSENHKHSGNKHSQGSDSAIECYDEGIDVEDILTALNQPQFRGRPKVCLIQADNLRLLRPGEKTKAGGFSGADDDIRSVARKIPTDADKLVLISTLPQALADRLEQASRGGSVGSNDSGRALVPAGQDRGILSSFLIQAYCEVVGNQETRDEDFLTQTTWINDILYNKVKQLRERDPEFRDANLPVLPVLSTMTELVQIYRYCQETGR